jgi:hypothetical protein
MLGSGTNRFNTGYVQYLDATSATIANNLYVNGEFFVAGNIVYVDEQTLNIANSTMVLSANAAYPALADGSGIYVAGADATLVYSATDNNWQSNLPVQAPAFVGDGSGLTNVSAAVDAGLLTGAALNQTVYYSNLQSVGTLNNLTVDDYITAGGTITATALIAGSISGNGAGLTGVTASAITGPVANATYATFAGTAVTANLAAVATQAVNAANAVYAVTAGTASTAGNADHAQLANCASYAITAETANSAVVAGMATTVGVLSAVTVTGAVTAATVAAGAVAATTVSATGAVTANGIFTNNYFYANGAPLIGNSSNYSNANVANYLPTYSGNLSPGNIIAAGNVSGSYILGNIAFATGSSQITPPVTSLGVPGDLAGTVAYSNTYFYYCTANYDGITNIWVRAALTAW